MTALSHEKAAKVRASGFFFFNLVFFLKKKIVVKPTIRLLI